MYSHVGIEWFTMYIFTKNISILVSYIIYIYISAVSVFEHFVACGQLETALYHVRCEYNYALSWSIMQIIFFSTVNH